MWLAIETAHTVCSVALGDGGYVISGMLEEIGRGHAERLVPMAAEVLSSVGVVPTRIVVDVGPGSFTGVRIGLAAARAFGLAWGCPVEGVSGDTLVARAIFALPDAPLRLLVVLDAMRGQVFAREWTRHGACGPTQVLSPAEASALVDHIGAAAGNGVPLLGGNQAWSSAVGPNAASVARLVAADLLLPAPLYFRAPDVERGT